MKIVLINTKCPGGASIACQRLYDALKNEGEEVTLLSPARNLWKFLWERFLIFITNHFSRKNLFAVSIANTGTNMSKMKVIQEADIIHLHWINSGTLSLSNIAQLTQLGKPIVWTCHDMWPFTGVCHHALGCMQYEQGCLCCPLLKKNRFYNLASYCFNKKLSISSTNIYFITVSSWLEQMASKSAIVRQVKTIPNSIDTKTFYPIEKSKARKELGIANDKQVLLMIARRLDDPIKGFLYLKEALQLLKHKENIVLCLCGIIDHSLLEKFPIEVKTFGSRSQQELNVLYAVTDCTIVPSLYETFGLTLSESLACGRPAVAFNYSGPTDIIQHKENGYLAEWKNSTDLARGIEYVLSHTWDETALRNSAEMKYSSSVLAKSYINLYKSLLKESSINSPSLQ